MADEIERRIRIPTDNEGYFSCECPHCGDRFKLHFGEFQVEDPTRVSCPACGLEGETAAFTLTDDIREVAEAETENIARELINEFQDEVEDMFRDVDFVEVESGKKLREKPVPELREFTDLAVAELPCCEAHVKVAPATASAALYCPYCSQITS